MRSYVLVTLVKKALHWIDRVDHANRVIIPVKIAMDLIMMNAHSVLLKGRKLEMFILLDLEYATVIKKTSMTI